MRHAANSGSAGHRDFAVLQRQLTPDQAEQRGFARAIAPDKPDFVAGGNGGRGPFEQGAAFDGIGDVFNFQHVRAMPYGRGRVNRLRYFAARPSGYSAGPFSSSLLPKGS